jgi:lipid-A-disaccharide synthase-like uncharacterized protein
MGRFVVQWLSSERRGRSVIPVAFWYLSLLGGGMLLVYSIHKQDPVFMLGQGLGTFIYLRNLQLISKERRRVASSVVLDSASSTESLRQPDVQPPALRSAG